MSYPSSFCCSMFSINDRLFFCSALDNALARFDIPLSTAKSRSLKGDVKPEDFWLDSWLEVYSSHPDKHSQSSLLPVWIAIHSSEILYLFSFSLFIIRS